MPANLEVRNGTYYWRQTIGGTLHRRSTGYPASGGRRAMELAQRKAAQFETEARAGKDGFQPKAIPTFGEWAEKFVEAYYPGKYTETLLLRRPVACWADLRLNEVTRSDVELFFRTRQADGARGGTLERERVLLKRLFRAAVDDGLLKTNPMQGLRAFKTTPKTRVMSRDEEARIREALSPSWNRFLTVALHTGLRLSELLGARPCDLREGGTWLWVRPECNKTRTGRLVPLRPEAREALAEQGKLTTGHMHRTVTSAIEMPYWPLTVAAPKVTMKRVCRRLKIEPSISVHDLRRTFGTRCAEGGMLLSHLQKIMGHHSPTITAKFYVHLEQKSIAEAINEVTL